jgi:phosphate:Na+ symporter
MQEPDQWWASCHVPENSMKALIEGVGAGRLAAVKVGLCLRNVYTSGQVFADFPGEAYLFLRPGKEDSTAESPETASGYVVHLALDFGKVSFGPLDHSERSPEGQQQTTGSEANSINALVDKLSKLVAGLKWLAVLVAVLVVVFAFKNR